MYIYIYIYLLLSQCSHAKETRKCYWCGPLAEQVHRSQRAPSCDNIENHITNCDPGYTHCAVVATSPPFVESRYCVKFYQDECYSLFCNSTKTWRMTCPCRGDLCNGKNNEREKEAFNRLAKLTEKTNYVRIKRAPISSSNFISGKSNDMKNDMVTETINNTTSETIKDNTDTEVDKITDVTSPEQSLNDTPIEIMSTVQVKVSESLNLDENVKVITGTPEPNNDCNDGKEITETIDINSVVEKAVVMATTLEETTLKLDDMKLNTVATNVAVEEMRIETSTAQSKSITTEQLPAAEALQQNTSPIEKSKEQMTPETTMLTTTQVITAMPTASKNNTATMLHRQLPTLIAGIVLNQYL
ncbi:hypothetical protein K1T71_012232 [Dendrolimus kikuchii]|uniref:Uncharacterized protein n=1 Tax=Dendrolimus kikuchii TaxID=765133 RepID=A0ACC1CKZ1_9NEOP|nr:hypothetical protein K1T71_012232 [Dendrolimus kikuchii]